MLYTHKHSIKRCSNASIF